MADLDQKNDGDMISELIAAEEKDALARFRASRFEDRLRNRIKMDRAQPSRPSALRAALRPVWISAAVLVVLGSAALIFLRSRPPAPARVMSVENVLRLLPGIQAIEKQKPGGLDIAPLSGSPLDQSIAAVLSSRIRPDAGSPALDRHPAPPSFDPARKPLDLQELYDLLIMNKSIERVLTLVSPKPKEG